MFRVIMHSYFKKVFVIGVLVSSQSAFAEWVPLIYKVKTLEATYMPNIVSFQLEHQRPGCGWLKWSKNNADGSINIESNKIIYSTLMTALVSGKRVKVYFDSNKPTTCNAGLLTLLSD